MTSCRHHSGYLADDEAGHTTYLARVQPPKKPALPEMGQASKLGHMPHPPSKHGHSARLHSHHRDLRDHRSFGNFLDFLAKGQVLDSLQTVVEKATERIATMKTEAGVPLVEVQDPVEVPRGRRRVRARPGLNSMHRHHVRPSLCTGNPNNYPSCSSSMSDSHSNFTAGWQGSHSQDNDLSYHGLGPLPPLRDKLLLEKSLKQLLRLENKRKSLGQSCTQGDSLLWDSVDSQSRTPKHPLLGFSGLLGSSLITPEASALGLGERELIFIKRELNKEIKSLMSQLASFDLPGYCSLQEPYRTLDFLAEHHLFPALQRVVSQAVDKLSGARRYNGCPLFLSEWEPTIKPNSTSNSNLSSEVTRGSKCPTTTEGEEHYDYLLRTTDASPKMVHKKSTKSGGGDKPKEDGSLMSSTQGTTAFKLKVTPIEEPKIPSPHPKQEVPDQDPKVQRTPMSTPGLPSSNQRAQPWRHLHITLPSPGIKVEVPSGQAHFAQVTAPRVSPCSVSSHHLPMFSPLTSLTPDYTFMKKKPLPSISSKSTESHFFSPGYEELVNYLMEQTVSLLICKYNYERSLAKQLGFISFPITEALMDLFLGFKKVKGSHIRLSSKINWSCLLHKLEEARWAEQVSRPVSQPVPLQASHHKASRRIASHKGPAQDSTCLHSMESPSTLPKPATIMDQEVAMEPCLHTELLGPQPPTPQEDSTAEVQEPTSLLEPKLSTSYGSREGSDESEQAVDVGESQGSEEEQDYNFFGDESESQSLPSQASSGGQGQPLCRQPWRPPSKTPLSHSEHWTPCSSSCSIVMLPTQPAQPAPALSRSQNGLNGHEELSSASQGSPQEK